MTFYFWEKTIRLCRCLPFRNHFIHLNPKDLRSLRVLILSIKAPKAPQGKL